MNNKNLFLLLTLSAILLSDSRFAFAQKTSDSDGRSDRQEIAEKSKPSKFIRLTKDERGNPESLQTSITRYQSEDRRLLIDLIGVVHIGEERYYRRLNRQFEQYDSLLYELVAPPESRVPTKNQSRSNNPISWLQGSMQNMLGLESSTRPYRLYKIQFCSCRFVAGSNAAKNGRTW